MTREVELLRYIDRVEQGRFRIPKEPIARGLFFYIDDCRHRRQRTISTDELLAHAELLMIETA